MIRYTTEITVPNKDFFLAPTIAFGREIAARAGFPLKDQAAIETAVREACHNVIAHAFLPEEDAIFDVTFDLGKNDLTVVVKDKGLPFQAIETRDLLAKYAEGQYQGLYLIKQAMDNVKFVNLGPEGKELHMTKYLPAKRVYELFSKEELAAYTTDSLPVDREIAGFRLLGPEDAVELSRIVYRVYGYTYSVRDYVYYPDRLAENLYNKNLTSLAAENAAGEVMAHCGLIAPEERSAIGEIGMGLVIPSYRGANLLKQMTDKLLELALERGLRGLYVESVTNHVLSQKSANRDGFRDCAFCFAALPEDFAMKQMEEGRLSQRGSLIISYRPLENNAQQNAFLPAHHAEMIKKIYRNIGVERNFDGLPTYYERRKISRFIVKTYPQMKSGWIRILNYGKDIFESVRDRVRELQHDRVEAIVLDLPLESTQTVSMCRIFEDMGFFFAGIIPDHLDGDCLRLIHFGAIDFDFDRLELHSDFAHELRDYCAANFLKNLKSH